MPPNPGYAPHWGESDTGFAPCPRCNLTTTYNEHDIATGAEHRDSQDKLLGHIVRTFDANGLVIAEQQIADAPDLMVPEGLCTNLNPDQSDGCWRIYGRRDDESKRLVLLRRPGPCDRKTQEWTGLWRQLIIPTYNDLGDKASETTTIVTNPMEIGNTGSPRQRH